MSELTRRAEDPLLRIQKDAYRCGKCMLCKWIDHEKMSDARFMGICPSGSRFRFEAYYASGRQEIARGLLEGSLDISKRFLHVLFTCTECGGCQVICSNVADRNPLHTIVALREKAFVEGTAPLPEHEVLISSVRNFGNPWQQPSYRRERWAKGAGLRNALAENVDFLYFTGCTTALQPSLNDIAHATVCAFEAAGLRLGALGKSEPCCGSTVLRIGDYGAFSEIASSNAFAFKNLKTGKIVTSCAGCSSTLREDYPEVVEFDMEVVHSVELLGELVSEGRIRFKKGTWTRVTYHDPCHLGRYLGIYEQPRNVIESIPGLELVEMPRNRENSFCCGAGAGVLNAFPDFAGWVAKERVEEALSTGAQMLITACPICVENLKGASEGRIEVEDLLVLAWKRMRGGSGE